MHDIKKGAKRKRDAEPRPPPMMSQRRVSQARRMRYTHGLGLTAQAMAGWSDSKHKVEMATEQSPNRGTFEAGTL